MLRTLLFVASVPLGLLGDYHRSPANQKVSGHVIGATFQKVSPKLPAVNSPGGPPRVWGETKSCKRFLILVYGFLL